MKRGLWFIVLLLLIPFCLGATIHGKVFDYNFRIAKNSVVTISSVPEQVVVAVDGNYSFTIPSGDYVISAFLNDASNTTIYFVEENFSVVNEGVFVRDLIMFPSDDLEELDLENDVSFDVDSVARVSVLKIVLIVVGLIIILLFFWLYCVAFKKCKRFQREDKGEKIKEDVKEKNIEPVVEEKDDLDDLKDFIKKNKRVNQKDVRKQFPVSEAKISLMLSDLESQGRIRKIKKGRGNIIVWNEK